MDRSEKIAEQYLRYAGFDNIVYEPDGNVAPDFLVDGRIAVEVRRLNQHFRLDEQPEALEETQFALLDRVRALLESFGAPNRGISWFVNYRYQRPVDPWKSLRPRFRKWLQSFRDGPQAEALVEEFGKGFEVSLLRSSIAFPNLFELGGFVDHDAGGWLLHELRRNLAHCIAEKTQKTERVRHVYPEWWLLLVDQIGYALSDYERESFRNDLPSIKGWDRIVLVSPLDHTRALVL